ncbi:lysophospholipid acyltransferase family protein [Nocardioides campestrisoli]|uniref:lysophospholipid acyltransferase family protein n=1 Tax=Nocardioides campestrisoli TaxID=2736757 RepID=UPI0028121F75|nr:lysophospholipid acyltransferase family protein [Nocardioides campestrisoli]
MPEAEIIPLGTGGRPGRGSGRDKPSAAARSLATGTPAKRAKPAKPAKPRAAEPKAAEPTETEAGEQTARGPFTTADREPTGGIPVGDWLAAIEAGAREVFGTHWERRLAELLAFARHRLDGDYQVDEFGFDQEVTERFLLAALRPIADKWFRIEVRGAENIPTEGGALVVSNHSGTIPVDGLMTLLKVHDETGRFLRPLGADLVFRVPLVAGLARRSGATLACQADAERMLNQGELVAVWPEGFKGVGKPFSERYKLQRFGRGGFVSAALRTGVPIVPLSVVGAEEIYPIVGNLTTLARLFNLPYLPVTPFFPLLGPLGMVPLPSKWLMEFGEPIRTDAYEEAEAEDPMLVFDLTDQVRETIQQTLFTLLRQRDSIFR